MRNVVDKNEGKGRLRNAGILETSLSEALWGQMTDGIHINPSLKQKLTCAVIKHDFQGPGAALLFRHVQFLCVSLRRRLRVS